MPGRCPPRRKAGFPVNRPRRARLITTRHTTTLLIAATTPARTIPSINVLPTPRHAGLLRTWLACRSPCGPHETRRRRWQLLLSPWPAPGEDLGAAVGRNG